MASSPLQKHGVILSRELPSGTTKVYVAAYAGWRKEDGMVTSGTWGCDVKVQN